MRYFETMKSLLLALAVVSSSAHSLAASFPQVPPIELAAEPAVERDLKPLAEAIRAGAEAQELVGLAAAYVENGKISAIYYGSEDREKKIDVGPATMFRWASVSKPMTAVAAMQLAQEKKLDLDADVRDYVAEFPEKPWPVTARQLMGHLGGVVHYRNGKVIRSQPEYDEEHPFASTILALDMFRESPLVAEPGTKYAYTTHGYMLLGAAVERAGRGTFAKQVQTRILKPLGMKACRPDYQWEAIEHRAVGYKKLGANVVRSTNTDVSWKLPGGGYVSTVDDMARFARGLMGEELLPREALDEMWTPMLTSDGASTGYGMGFGVREGVTPLRISHSGAQEKTRTLMQVLPDEGRALVIMTNSEYANVGVIAKAAWASLD